MKTQVTIELDDDQRIAVGLLETGLLIPATRDEVRRFVTEMVMSSVNTATVIVVDRRTTMAAEIRDSLGLVSNTAEE